MINHNGQSVVTVLIVEDDLDLVETYTDLLEGGGYAVISVLRAADAIQVASHQKPDFIILDLNLPGDSGWVVLNFVRRYPPIAHTKIIIATGQPDMINKAAYISHKADAVLTKPITNYTLLETMHELLDASVV
ncbi:MAG: response regulator [Chitinophagaceae bacterium]|nr:response regulator [Anaerolineae bacterium]